MNQFKAARSGDLQQLRGALTVDNVNDGNVFGCTALHCAASDGHDECVKFCIEMGTNVNARANGGLTPLHVASSNGHVNVVRLLLNAGAMVEVTDRYGWTPLHRAIDTKRVDVARRLIDRGVMVSNVKLDEHVPEISDWITTFIDSRSNCRCAAIAFIGVHRYHRTTMTGNNDINVLQLISKHIWSSRLDDSWNGTTNKEHCQIQSSASYCQIKSL
jgi:ankyrin repeat protein